MLTQRPLPAIRPARGPAQALVISSHVTLRAAGADPRLGSRPVAGRPMRRNKAWHGGRRPARSTEAAAIRAGDGPAQVISAGDGPTSLSDSDSDASRIIRVGDSDDAAADIACAMPSQQ